ncbi:fungal specific transcription factor domain containing protein [Apiospora rasikravindrae]|uniref:Fungal specific transcription factor domain containing protein n=1 Tax=Apiospora rasikravindrae TaxID=990691 RepID=A0ABR1S0I7_9PEZI
MEARATAGDVADEMRRQACCPVCNRMFTRQKGVEKHFANTHVGTACHVPGCGHTAATEAGMKVHPKEGHPTRPPGRVRLGRLQALVLALSPTLEPERLSAHDIKDVALPCPDMSFNFGTPVYVRTLAGAAPRGMPDAPRRVIEWLE